VIHATEIEQLFKQDMQDDKLIKTNADNQYHIHLALRADESVKIAALKKKIEEKEKILKQLS